MEFRRKINVPVTRAKFNSTNSLDSFGKQLNTRTLATPPQFVDEKCPPNKLAPNTVANDLHNIVDRSDNDESTGKIFKVLKLN